MWTTFKKSFIICATTVLYRCHLFVSSISDSHFIVNFIMKTIFSVCEFVIVFFDISGVNFLSKRGFCAWKSEKSTNTTSSEWLLTKTQLTRKNDKSWRHAVFPFHRRKEEEPLNLFITNTQNTSIHP